MFTSLEAWNRKFPPSKFSIDTYTIVLYRVLEKTLSARRVPLVPLNTKAR